MEQASTKEAQEKFQEIMTRLRKAWPDIEEEELSKLALEELEEWKKTQPQEEEFFEIEEVCRKERSELEEDQLEKHALEILEKRQKAREEPSNRDVETYNFSVPKQFREKEPNHKTTVTTPKNSNTITQPKEKNKKEKTQEEILKDIYQWSCKLTTEQGEDEFFWISESKALLTRLKMTRGNRIAVVGLQGSGKTALKQALHKELLNFTYDKSDSGKQQNIFSLKWQKGIEERIKYEIDAEEYGFLNVHDPVYFHELFDALKESIDGTVMDVTKRMVDKLHLKKDSDFWLLERYLEMKYATVHRFMGSEIRPRDYTEKELKNREEELMQFIPNLERALGKQRVDEIRKSLMDMKIRYAHTILIDLPDYSRTNSNQMNRDLSEIDAYWEQNMCKSIEGIYKQDVNLVVFFQKELFKGHFSLGKYDVIEIKPLLPEQLLSAYRNNFGKTPTGLYKQNAYWPFENEQALSELASLSRGIFRRFKKYVRICLEKLMEQNRNTITLDNVQTWISLEQVVKDMELELMTIFPKSRELRKYTVKLLSYLRENGKFEKQSVITEKIFDGAKMKCSRLLSKLDSWDYITQERDGKDKIIRII